MAEKSKTIRTCSFQHHPRMILVSHRVAVRAAVAARVGPRAGPARSRRKREGNSVFGFRRPILARYHLVFERPLGQEPCPHTANSNDVRGDISSLRWLAVATVLVARERRGIGTF